jgi:hypothetical protein
VPKSCLVPDLSSLISMKPLSGGRKAPPQPTNPPLIMGPKTAKHIYQMAHGHLGYWPLVSSPWLHGDSVSPCKSFCLRHTSCTHFCWQPLVTNLKTCKQADDLSLKIHSNTICIVFINCLFFVFIPNTGISDVAATIDVLSWNGKTK